MASDVAGSDYSWLAVDQHQRVGWFTINGAGRVPHELRDPALLNRHEDSLAAFVRASGLRFGFGEGDQMWHDTAACGIFAFDWSTATDRYELLAQPAAPISIDDLPMPLQQLCVVRLPTAFALGHVTSDAVT